MAFRIYLVPIVTDINPASGRTRRAAKYFSDGTILPGDYTAMDYGFEPWMIVGADLSPQDDLTVTGKADAFALPFDLSQPLTAQQVTNVKNKLEAINLPAGWVDTSFTWQQLVRIVLGIFSFMQAFYSFNRNVSLFAGGVTLNTTIGSLAVDVRNNLIAAADRFTLDRSGVTGATTIRAMLKVLGTQLAQRPYNLSGVMI